MRFAKIGDVDWGKNHLFIQTTWVNVDFIRKIEPWVHDITYIPRHGENDGVKQYASFNGAKIDAPDVGLFHVIQTPGEFLRLLDVGIKADNTVCDCTGIQAEPEPEPETAGA